MRPRHYIGLALAVLTLGYSNAIVETGADHLVWLALVVVLLVCILFAVLGPVADYLGERR